MSSTSDPASPAFAPQWLALREKADADARATALLDPLRVHLSARGAGAGGRPIRVADLGCGSGSQGRWLAPRLSGAQSWTLYDLDPCLLDLAGARMPRTSADGSTVNARMCRQDLGELTIGDLDGIDVVTGSALLDLLDRQKMESLARAVVGADCAALFTLSVTGRVELFPTDPADPVITTAFNDHQRRRGLLGPDAVPVTVEVFQTLGWRVLTFPSPWRLCPEHSALTREWLRGWVKAAAEQDPASVPSDYPERRLNQCETGELGAHVEHTDLLALPAS